MKELDDDTKRLIKHIVDHFDDEDRGVRDRQIRQWRRLKLMWENIQHTYYSEVAHDWRIPESERVGEDSDQGYYDKPVNIFRAYLESIIAALSVTVPPITCYPDDADNPLDIDTAKAGNKIAELVFKHNNAPLLWIHALFIFCTEGMTACYSYPQENEEYGTYEENQYEEETEDHEMSTCPYCGAEMGDKVINPVPQDQFEQEQMQPPGLTPISNPMAQSPDMMGQDPMMGQMDPMSQMNQLEECPSCGRMVLPQKEVLPITVTRLVGVTKHPKSRICMEVFGGLFVKVPVWARCLLYTSPSPRDS